MREAAAAGAVRRLALALALVACESTPAPAPAEPTPNRGVDPQARAQAHRDAWARLQPLAQAALEHGDPLGTAALERTLPRALPYGGSALLAARKAQDAAWREAKDLDGALLEPEPRMMLRATRFALSRLRDGFERRPPTRTDPTVAVAQTLAGLALVRARWLPACAGCTAAEPAAIDAALQTLALSLELGVADLGACSSAGIDAAQRDLAALTAAVAALPERSQPGAVALDAAITRARARLGAIAAALPQAKPLAWGEPVRAAADPAAVARLPDRLGAAELRRRLDVEESFTTEAKVAFGQLSVALQQFTAMLQRHADEPGTATPVDAARCEAAWKRLEPLVAGQPALAGAAIDCAAFARDAGPLDDAGLMLRVVQLGVVDPVEHTRRSGSARLLALVRGEIAPVSHRHALAIAVLSGLRDEAARARAVAAARDDVCLALSSLWIHGGLGDDATLATTLGDRCGTTAWRDAALAHPRASLGGLGLWLLALGPADAVALEAFWWLPLGLVIDAARPPREPDTPVESKVEPLTPAPAEVDPP